MSRGGAANPRHEILMYVHIPMCMVNHPPHMQHHSINAATFPVAHFPLHPTRFLHQQLVL